ncbi:putative regulator of chromatin subfamily A 1A [Dirofilaria immitis]
MHKNEISPIISTFIIVIHKGISQQIWKLTDFKHSICKPCDDVNLDRIFDNLQKEEPAFSNGSIEVLIGVSYRRGDGFRWMDNTAPDDLNFLKFNPIDNLDDEDNLTEYHCLRFSIIVNKNAKDGYETKRYECYGKNSIEYVKKSFYLLYSYSKDEEIQETDGRPKQKNCRRNEIPVIINETYLCYVHLVDIYSLGSIVNADFDICNEYSSEYGSETERWNQLSPAAVPSKTLLQLLHKEILSVNGQFDRKTHGLMIGLMYMYNEYQWKDGISVVYPSLRNLIAGTNTAEECYRFMLFQSVPDYIVPVPCSDGTITYDILCKYILDKQPVMIKSALIEEIKVIIDHESKNDAIKNNAKSYQTSRINLLITLLFYINYHCDCLYQRKKK